MAGITSLLGIGSSRTEISDDEASDVSAEYEAPAPVKQAIKPEKKEVDSEKKGKATPKAEENESLMVESVKDGEEEDDDEEVGEDECVPIDLCGDPRS